MNMRYTLKQLKSTPEIPGIYKFYSQSNSLLYVGKAKNLRIRISNYFNHERKDAKTEKLVSQIAFVDIIPVNSELEALLLEAKLIKASQPKYNVIWKDDKHYLYIKITKETYPKVLFTRKEIADGEYFGPFPNATVVKQILAYIRTVFPYCTQKATAKRRCFYNHLGLCNPCPAVISKLPEKERKLRLLQYRSNILNIKKILQGKITKVRKLLQSRMKAYSDKQEFEQAVIYREKLKYLDYLVNHAVSAESYLANPRLLANIRNGEQNQLVQILKPFFPILASANHIECYDISNISGKLATGSMVTFINGQPRKNFYRHFRIKSGSHPDDFGMLSEVMARRLKHKEWPLPELFLIDGGKPQLIALKRVLTGFDIKLPMIGLAKRDEEMVIPSGNSYIKMKLQKDSPALNLIKRIRDEAHRFAHNYHLFLRLKYLMGSVENR